jgi:hypothetical protein
VEKKDSFHASDRADPAFAACVLRDGGQDYDLAARPQASAYVGRALDMEPVNAHKCLRRAG